MHAHVQRTHIYAHRSNGKKDKDSDSSDEEDSEKKKLKGQLEGISMSPCVSVSISVVTWGGTSTLCVYSIMQRVWHLSESVMTLSEPWANAFCQTRYYTRLSE